MGLLILTTLICLASLSSAMCPPFRPLTARNSCRKDINCPEGKSCCPYNGSKFCVSTNPNICNFEGNVIKKLESIHLKDNCTTCVCYGYDDVICSNDGCARRKPSHKSGSCPFLPPSSSKKRCSRSSDCSPGYICCKYFFDHFCILDNPNICYFKGELIPVGRMVTQDDGCTECECQGHDSFLCINDGCFWPKPPKIIDCNYGGKLRENGSSFLSNDGCNKCWCSFGRVMCTLKACIKHPFNKKRLH